MGPSVLIDHLTLYNNYAKLKNIEKVKELSASFQEAKAIYFTEYHGLNVEQITKLRSMFLKKILIIR